MAREIDLYNIGSSPEQMLSALKELRADFDAHNHDGTSSRAFQTVTANTINTQTFLVRKTSYSDTTGGIWMGIVDGIMKLNLGDASNFLTWNGTTLTVQGSVVVTSLSGAAITGGTISGAAISGGSITSTTMDSTTVTGGTIRTSSGSTRVELNGTDNALYLYQTGNLRLGITENAIVFLTASELGAGEIYGYGTNALAIDVNAGKGGITIDTASVLPINSGNMNLGDASNYFNDVSYKTLTDRGCLGWYDDGVELADGRVVPDTEALLSIKPHPTRKTPKGKVRMDYKTMPKHVYSPAMINGKLLPRDENDQPYTMKDGKKVIAEDGAETTALIAIMIGAIKELTLRVKDLEGKLST